MCLQDKAPSKPDLVLVGHEDIAPFALGTCQPEPLVASGGKDTTVSATAGLSQNACVGLAGKAVLHAAQWLVQLWGGAAWLWGQAAAVSKGRATANTCNSSCWAAMSWVL